MKKLYNLLLLSVCLPMFLSSCLGDLDTVPLTDDKLLPEKAWEDPNACKDICGLDSIRK